MKRYKAISFSEIEPQFLTWLWYRRIPYGKITILVGNGGVGKSILSMYIAAQVSRGAEWPDCPGIREGFYDEETGEHTGEGVIILTTEDDLADTTRVRLGAAGANLRNIHTCSVEKVYNDIAVESPIYDLLEDMDILEDMIKEKGNIGLIILDPITAYMGTLNGNNNTEVRYFMNPLKELAEKYELAILGISHFNKGEDMSAINRTLGSVAFVAAARSVWAVFTNPADEDSRLLLPVKGNLGKNPKGLEYRLVDVNVDTVNGDIDSVKCEFDRLPLEKTADEAFVDEKKKQRAPVKHSVKKWLKDVLKEGSVDVKVIESRAVQENINTRTLRRAKEEMGVRSKKEGKKWVWMLGEKER
jgi:putative DNA primase/helicase